MVKRKKQITKKEKREIGLILGSVFLVAIVGLMITDDTISTVGQATHLTVTTYSGTLTLLNEYCSPIKKLVNCELTCNAENMDPGPPITPQDEYCLCCSVQDGKELQSPPPT